MRHSSIRVLAGLVLVALAGCSSRASIPAGDSDVDIQAATVATSDVKYIEIIVHQLSDGALVYNSGIQPSSNFQDTRQHLEELVPLAAATDFVFDANAYDVNQVFLKAGNTVQEATQPAGTTTTVLIVIDLNSGDTNPTAETDITAVTDNIPTIDPPTLQIDSSTGTYTMHTTATDLDQDTDGGPAIDGNETLTYFSAVLAGNVSGPTALFTEGQDFSFTFNDTQPVKILSCVVDRLNQLTFEITEIDPVVGSFHTVEFGEGYALFDGNTTTPPIGPRKVNGKNATGDPTGPTSGPIAVAVLKHGPPDPASGGGFAVEAISRSDDSLVVTPNNVAYWNDTVVASFNRYEEQPDANGNIVVDFKLRVALSPPPAATVSTPNPATPLIIDTIKMANDGDGHFVFLTESQEAATIALPSIGAVTAASEPIEVDGSFFTGAYDPTFAFEPTQANDQRQIYLQMGGVYAYPTDLMLLGDGELLFDLPDDLPDGSWDVVVCSFGRLCTVDPGAITSPIVPPPPPPPQVESFPAQPPGYQGGELTDVNNAGILVGWFATASVLQGAVWTSVSAAPMVLPGSDPTYNYIVANAVSNGTQDSSGLHYLVAGYESGSNGDSAIVWDENGAPTQLPTSAPFFNSMAFGIERNPVGGTEIVGLAQLNAEFLPFAWIQDSSGTYQGTLLAIPPITPANGGSGSYYISATGASAGIVAGTFAFTPDGPGDFEEHAVIWPTSNSTILLGEAGHEGSTAIKIAGNYAVGGVADNLTPNNSGQYPAIAAVWTYDPGAQTWSDPVLLPSPDGATATLAVAVSEGDSFGNGPSIGGMATQGVLEPLIWTSDGSGGWVVHVLPAQIPALSGVGGLNDSDEVAGFDGSPNLAVWQPGY